MFRAGRKQTRATRWILGHLRGQPLTAEEYACHHCDNGACINFERHLYIGDARTNARDISERKRHPLARKTHCPQGHEYTEENTRRNKHGHRFCRSCLSERGAERARRRQEFNPDGSRVDHSACEHENTQAARATCRRRLMGITGREVADPYERFMAMVDTETTPDGCHGWTGRLTDSGYGWFNPGKDGTRAAHRWIMEYHLGRKLKRDELVLHSCDNRPCTRIAHLRVGTASDNMRDVVERNPNHNANRALCVRGHELSGDNLYADKRGRRCKKCTRLRERGYAEKRRKESPPPPPATHCVNGHEWNDENTHTTKRGYRVCRACHRERERARQQRIREERRAVTQADST